MKTCVYLLAMICSLVACQKESVEMPPTSAGIYPTGYTLEIRREAEPVECGLPDCAVEIKNYKAALQQLADETCQSKIGDFTCCMNGWETCVLIIVEPDKWKCPVRMASEEQAKPER